MKRSGAGRVLGIGAGVVLGVVVLVVAGALVSPSNPAQGDVGTPSHSSPANAGGAVGSPRATPTPSHTPTSTHTGPSHTPTPTPTHSTKPTHTAKPTHSPTPKPTVGPLCGAPANPYGFNFCGRGEAIYASALPGSVCSYFDCIPNFDNGVGYMVECKDTTYSMSGGRSGACSHHSGEWREVYRGP